MTMNEFSVVEIIIVQSKFLKKFFVISLKIDKTQTK